VTERKAHAVWVSAVDRNTGVLIDKGGHQLTNIRLHGQTGQTARGLAAADLPVVTGRNAGAHAASILAAVAGQPSLRNQIVAYHRIDDRRWDLELQTGARILLPEFGVGTALQLLARPQFKAHLAAGQSLDVRTPGKVVLRSNLTQQRPAHPPFPVVRS